MNQDSLKKSRAAAEFLWNVRLFFKDLSLLMYAIAESLTSHGYTTKPETYGLPFLWTQTWGDRSDWTVINGFHGSYSEKKLQDAWDKEMVRYIYGLVFKLDTDPTSSMSPWLPYLYFLKGTLSAAGWWDHNKWNHKLVYSRNSEGEKRPFTYFREILPSQNEELKDIGDKVSAALVVKIPLGAISSTEDVRKIVLPIASALQREDENDLAAIAEYLVDHSTAA